MDKKNSMKLFTPTSFFKDDGKLDWHNIVRNMIALMAFFILFFLLLFAFLRPQMQAIALWVTQTFGYVGVFLYTFVVDMLIVPLTVDVIFPFAHNYSIVPFLLTLSVASSLGGLGGYWIGRLLGHLTIVKVLTSRFTHDAERLIEKYGVWAIVIAGLTPIPFSTVCWISGMLKVQFFHVALATLSRFPRMIIYYLAVQAGLMVFL